MRKLIIPILLFVTVLFSLQIAQAKCKAKADLKNADRLYFDKNFAEALKSYLTAYEKECVDGITCYKIAFCYMKAGKTEKDKEFLDLAIEKLQAESSSKPSLENLFYLANCYINLNLKDKATETSKQLIDLYEKGSLGKLKDTLSIFRVGKVYFDAQSYEKGIEYYRKAYTASRKNLPQDYLKMILQRLAEYDYRVKYFAGASEEFEALVGIDPKYDDAYFYLAIISMNLGQFEKAEGAWKKVIELGLPNSDEAQYNHRIARAALDESPLPEVDKSERKYKEINSTELENAIQALSKEGSDLKNEALDKKRDSKSITDDLKKIRKHFIAACAEYISRGLFIRDNAITRGYAVQIMRKDAWEIPEEGSQ